MGGRHCALPPNPPPAFSTLSYQTNISIHPPIIQIINLTICLFVYLYIYIYESRSNYLHRHGGEALRPPPNPPPAFLYFIKHHRIQKIYTCIPPSLIQVIALGISLFVYRTLCRPPFFINMFNDDPKNVYLYPSITHSINRSMYLFLCLFDSLSFMQCSRFCPPNAMGGRCCALPPNPPPAFLYFRKHHRIQKIYTCIPPSLIQVIALGISLFVYRALCRPPFFINMFNDDPKNVYLYPSITHSINRSMYLFLCLFDSLSFMQCSRFCPPNAMGGRCCALPPNPPPAFLHFSNIIVSKKYILVSLHHSFK